MAIESLPEFSAPARRRWLAIPAPARKRLLGNVWCVRCQCEVTITQFSGRIERGDLVLQGQCAECQGEVARVIEGG